MKTKNSIQIVETPIIDKYDFHENNGIINPAFLESHPEPDINITKSLVDNDYRNCFSPKNSVSAVRYPIDDLTIEHRPNGTSVASSWVYEFNNGCSTSTTPPNMTSSTNSLNGMYRSAYGMGYNDHLSYDMDLNRDHRKNGKGDKDCMSRCWPYLVRLFVWTVIVVCLLGVFISIAFIIYIERFAPQSCCVETNITNSTDSPQFGLNETFIGLNFSTTVGVELTSAKSGLTTDQTNVSEVEAKTTPKLTTKSFFNTTTDLSTDRNNNETDSKSEEPELNVTQVSVKTPETTKPMLISQTTTPSTTGKITVTQTTPTPTPTTSRIKISPKQVYSTPESPTEQPITSTVKTSKSSFEPRVMTTNYSQTPEPAQNSDENTSSDEIIGHKSDQNITATTSSPEETTHKSIPTTTTGIEMTMLDEMENSTTHYEIDSESLSTSSEESDYNQTETTINQKEKFKKKRLTTAQPSVVKTTTITTTVKGSDGEEE